VLQDKFSTYPGIQDILAHVKADKAARKERQEIYYNDDRLAELAKPAQSQTTNDGVGAETKNSVVESVVSTIDVNGTATA
jgi:homogentisate 1,2-dioxygenase